MFDHFNVSLLEINMLEMQYHFHWKWNPSTKVFSYLKFHMQASNGFLIFTQHVEKFLYSYPSYIEYKNELLKG